MCGIIGFIANRKHGFNKDEVNAVKDMLYINALRGVDSTGVFYVNNQGETQIHKDVGESSKFLKTKEWESTDKELFRNGQAIVGHCRWGTRGAKTEANAHPFIVDNKIVLVHNGSYLGSHDHLAKTDVDSHAIAHAISEAGDNISSALKRINAHYALVWYNTETNRLYAVRNQHRPLYFAQLEDGSMMFASEIGFLFTAAWRNNLKIAKDFPKMLPEHQLFSCNLADLSEDYQYDDIDCEYIPPNVEKEEPKKVEPKSQTNVQALPAPRKKDTNSGDYNLSTLTSVAVEMGIGKAINSHQLHQLAAPNTVLFVEADDYYCVDEKTGLYFVYGKIHNSDHMLDGMIAGWEITAKSEMDVINYTYNRFYNCTVEYMLSKGPTKMDAEITVVWKMKEAVETALVSVDTMELNA